MDQEIRDLEISPPPPPPRGGAPPGGGFLILPVGSPGRRRGLVDDLAPARTLLTRAVALAEQVAGKAPRRTRDLAPVEPEPDLFSRVEAGLRKSARGRNAPQAAFECVRRSLHLTFEEALIRERETFLSLVSSDESKALRHVFLAEREAQKAGAAPAGSSAGKDGPARPLADEAAAARRFRAGQTVIHDRFGYGTVLRVEGAGADAKLTVSFPGRGATRLMARFAGLKPA